MSGYPGYPSFPAYPTYSGYPGFTNSVAQPSEAPASNRDTGLKADLLKALEAIQTSGSFAAFHALARAPPAGLFVDGIGSVDLPLGEGDAQRLIDKARQAPFGRGSETVIDTAIRNTWELDAA